MSQPLVFAVIGDSHYVRRDSHEGGFSRNQFGDLHDLERYSDVHQRFIPAVIREIAGQKPAFVINTGDVIQNNCDSEAAALSEMEEALARMDGVGAPVFYALGNHDGRPQKEPVRLMCEANSRALGLPLDRSLDRGYFSFARGNSFFIILDYTRFRQNDEQAAFIRESFEQGSRYEHVFVFAHPPLVPIVRPFFSSFDFAEAVLLAAAEFRVDAYFCGHTHDQIASLHRVGGHWLPQFKSSVIGDPADRALPIEEVRPLLPPPESFELCWGYMEDTAPGWWIVTVDGAKVTVDWHVLGRGVAGRLEWEGREKPRMTLAPDLSGRGAVGLPPLERIRAVRLRAAGSSGKEGSYRVSLNGRDIGYLPRMGAFAPRSFLEVERDVWPTLGECNRLVVTTPGEDMCVGGFVLEVETDEGWARSVPTSFFTNTDRWDNWRAHDLRHIAVGAEIEVELGFGGDNKMASFVEKLQPAPVGGGFRMEDYWVWCGSVIQGEDGKYHMFASRWPKALSFTPNWVTNSEIVRAVSDTPEGPYSFAEVVLAPRGSEYWDGRMTHNPTIHRCGDTYLLFYTGTTYEEPMPAPGANPLVPGSIQDQPLAMKARANQRIGLATAKSVFGPWTRRDQPVLMPRPGKWDSLMTTNPAPCVKPDGSVLLIYKSAGNQRDLLRMGVSYARHFDGPYERLSDDMIFRFDESGDHIEDGYVWWAEEQNRYEIIMKDMNGGICGERHAGIHGYSLDGVHWHISEPPLAYSRKIRWEDGSETVQGSLERPQLLFLDGKPTHLFAATADGPGGFHRATTTWNMVIPLKF